MKKTIITILSLSTLFLTSCGDILSGGDQLNDSEGLKTIKSLLENQFGAETEVYSLDLSSTDHLTSEFGLATISYLDKGVDYSRSYMTYLGPGKELQEAEAASESFQKEFFLKKKQGKIKLNEFDFDQILVKFNEATAMISSEYDTFTLYSWDYEVNNDGGISADFTIEGTKKGEGTSLEGRNIVTNYYEFQFEMNEDGEVVPKD